jgi:hypothetical protein
MVQCASDKRYPLPVEEQNDTRVVLRERIPLGFKYDYDRDREHFNVLTLGVNRIVNLQILCELLTYNSVRIARLDCNGNLVPSCDLFLTFLRPGEDIGIEGAECLTRCLRLNTTLRRLDIPLNRIRDRGTKWPSKKFFFDYLAQSLSSNMTLQEFNTAYNNIGDRGAKWPSKKFFFRLSRTISFVQRCAPNTRRQQ